jgi:hypothetical protein
MGRDFEYEQHKRRRAFIKDLYSKLLNPSEGVVIDNHVPLTWISLKMSLINGKFESKLINRKNIEREESE